MNNKSNINFLPNSFHGIQHTYINIASSFTLEVNFPFRKAKKSHRA